MSALDRQRRAPGGLAVRAVAVLYAGLGGCLAILLPLSPLALIVTLVQGGPPGGTEEWPMVLITTVLGFVLGTFGAASCWTAWRLWRGQGRLVALVLAFLWAVSGMWPLGILTFWALLRGRGQEIEL